MENKKEATTKDEGLKISFNNPPNYKVLTKRFPAIKHNMNVVFTYGDTLYVLTDRNVSEELMTHEEVHSKRQLKMGAEKWWIEYCNSEEFRLAEELEAYRAQYKYMLDNYNRHDRRGGLQRIAGDLSSAIYGNIVTKVEAEELIKEL